ncbi:MAG: BON domain-containing protein [Hellea sp.]|nr:BON domain-containing protein [Hellea sp.]
MAMTVSAFAMGGCSVTSAGVKKGDERNMSRSIDDVSAGRAIKARLARAYDFDLGKVDVEVAEGIAVLTGTVGTENDRLEAEKIAWSAPNVVQVGNEIRLNNGTDVFRDSKDAIIQTRIRTRLMTEKGVKARNVNIETENGVVYLLGVARDKTELHKMTEIASTTDGVKEVISYIRIHGQPITTQAGFSAAPRSSGPLTLDPNIPRLAAPGQPNTPETEPFYRDPKTGEKIILPPGTKTIPYNPNGAAGQSGAPYYINPSNGEKVQIVFVTRK